MKTRMILSTMVLVVGLALAPAALANSSVETYGGQGGEVAGSVSSGGPTDLGATADADANSSSALPFTGLDLELLAGGGLLLLLGGFGMARMVARREDTV